MLMRQAPGYGPISTSMDTAEERLLPDAENHKEPRTWMRTKSLEQGASSDQETLLSRLPGRSESASATPWWLPTHSPPGSPHKDSSLLSVERYSSSQNGRHSSSLPRESLRPWVPGAMPDPARRPLSQSSEERSPATAGRELDSSKREIEMDAGAVAAIEAPSPWSRPDKAIWGRCDSITDDRMPRPASSPVVDSVTEVIELEHDFYSISLTPQVPCWAAMCAPLASCIAQLLVLYFLAYQNETMFEGGKWKQPISPYWSLNTMKMISIMLSLFKVSIELGHAQRLCRCLVVGAFAEGFRPVVGWWALALQYFMALLVLFVSLSVVLGSTSCVGCFLKIFSVFIIVDMDNLAAGFVDGMTYLDFRVEVSPERLQAFKRRHGGICRCLSIRAIFMFMPVTLILLSLAMSIYFNTIPLTLLSFGQVSNEDSPKMLVDDGTCVAQLVHHKGQGLSANVSVLLLAALDADSDKALAPRLHWVALEYAAQPVTPSSLQVMRGNDANNNGVFKSGSAATVRSQAYHWLETHGFSPQVYSNLLKREKLYKTFQPFEATFLIPGIQEDAPASYTPSTYMVYVTAQNPLSLLIPACAQFCTSCELAGPRLCDEGKCIEGTHFHLGKCYPCAKDCDKCELNALGHNMSDSESIGCDNGGCKEGFGLKHGRCQPCKDANCSRCLDEDLDVCVECKHGLSINFNGWAALQAESRCRLSHEAEHCGPNAFAEGDAWRTVDATVVNMAWMAAANVLSRTQNAPHASLDMFFSTGSAIPALRTVATVRHRPSYNWGFPWGSKLSRLLEVQWRIAWVVTENPGGAVVVAGSDRWSTSIQFHSHFGEVGKDLVSLHQVCAKTVESSARNVCRSTIAKFATLDGSPVTGTGALAVLIVAAAATKPAQQSATGVDALISLQDPAGKVTVLRVL
ncbi:OGG1 [Symbiodinium sp. CCMP2592]|nr:OGG1 [Symbiodinium sp. CCMP2592]